MEQKLPMLKLNYLRHKLLPLQTNDLKANEIN